MHGLQSLIEQLRRMESEKQQLGQQVRQLSGEIAQNATVYEPHLITEMQKANLHNQAMAGIDGSIVKRELHGIDIVITRAAAAFFSFYEGALYQHWFLPHNRTPQVTALNSLDSREFQITSALLRMEQEVDIAIAAVQNTPDIVMLDGSLIPTYIEEPTEDMDQRYQRLLQKYQQLYQLSVEYNVYLMGVVEDSRGKRFTNLAADIVPLPTEEQETLATLTDTTFLHYVLKPGERTCLFNYYAANSAPESPYDFVSFYMKNVSNDIPVRVEFIGKEDYVAEAKYLASIVYATASVSSQYGIPPVLIEADQRAKLSQQDADMVTSSITSRLGMVSSIRDLRRNRRPF